MAQVRHGVRDGYAWFWSREGRLPDLLDAVPGLVLSRVVAVTAFDSGPLRLSDDERVAGWSETCGVSLSPPVQDASALPIGGWDEWYVLDAPRRLPGLHVFVNYSNFTPSPEPLGRLDPTWDRAAAEEALRHTQERAERFWSQLLSVRPRVYLAEGDSLTCVTNDATLFAAVGAALDDAAGEDG